MEKILHICPENDWRMAIEKGMYEAASLDVEGFIHCSKPEQVLDVSNRYYSGTQGLVLLWIDPTKLANELRQEISERDVFPHLYGPLNLDAVFAVPKFMPDSDGVFRTLPKLD